MMVLRTMGVLADGTLCRWGCAPIGLLEGVEPGKPFRGGHAERAEPGGSLEGCGSESAEPMGPSRRA